MYSRTFIRFFYIISETLYRAALSVFLFCVLLCVAFCILTLCKPFFKVEQRRLLRVVFVGARLDTLGRSRAAAAHFCAAKSPTAVPYIWSLCTPGVATRTVLLFL